MVVNTLFKRLFPVKHDFYGMISEQAKATTDGVTCLYNWINSRSKEDYQILYSQIDEVDIIRFNMEKNLIEAFATPFDRQDIYTISLEMFKIIAYVKSTLKEMQALEVNADLTIMNMVQQLIVGTEQLVKAIDLLKEDPLKSQITVGKIRKVQLKIEDDYRVGMTELFNGSDLMHAMKYMEVYRHIKDAATQLGYTTDVLKKIIVRVI